MPTVLVILGVVSQKDRQGNVSDFLHRVRCLVSVLYLDWQHSTDSDREVWKGSPDTSGAICQNLWYLNWHIGGWPGSNRLCTWMASFFPSLIVLTFSQSVLSCVKAVQIFVDAKPSIISSTKAASLLPYLKNASTVSYSMLQSFTFLIIEQIEEQNIADNLLRIFRACIPSMTKAALKFGQELQTSLQLMIVKPSSAGGLQVMLCSTFQIFCWHLASDDARGHRLLLCGGEPFNARLYKSHWAIKVVS